MLTKNQPKYPRRSLSAQGLHQLCEQNRQSNDYRKDMAKFQLFFVIEVMLHKRNLKSTVYWIGRATTGGELREKIAREKTLN